MTYDQLLNPTDKALVVKHGDKRNGHICTIWSRCIKWTNGPIAERMVQSVDYDVIFDDGFQGNYKQKQLQRIEV